MAKKIQSASHCDVRCAAVTHSCSFTIVMVLCIVINRHSANKGTFMATATCDAINRRQNALVDFMVNVQIQRDMRLRHNFGFATNRLDCLWRHSTRFVANLVCFPANQQAFLATHPFLIHTHLLFSRVFYIVCF